MSRRYGSLTVETSNEDKILYPDAGITKGQILDYYEQAAQVMLPHMVDRPVTMHRFPDGISEEGFYQKQAQDWFPEWIETREVSKEGGSVRHVLCQNAATLVYLANLACLTPHVWLSRAGELDKPDRLVFDLDPPGDPDEEGTLELVRFGARSLRGLLEDLGLTAWVKSTGSRGLHVTVPLRSEKGFDTVREFARGVCEVLARRHPDRLTTAQRREKRGARLYLDTGRNAWAQTAVAPYALRARPGAPVAAPLDWDELGEGFHPRRWILENLFRRLGHREDP